MREVPTTLEAGASATAVPAIGVDPEPAVDQPAEVIEQPALPLDEQTHLPPEKRELP